MSTLTRSARPMTAPQLRMTARGRVLLTTLLLLLLVTAAVLATGSGTAVAGFGRPSSAVGSSGRAAMVTVAPGETVWAIAQRIAPDTDPRETVARLLRVNHLQTAQVRAGMSLRLP